MFTSYDVNDGILTFHGIERLSLPRSCACGQSFRWRADGDGFTAPAWGRMIHAEQDKGNAVYDAAWVAVPVPTLDDEAMQDLMVETLELVINGDKQKQRMAG